MTDTSFPRQINWISFWTSGNVCSKSKSIDTHRHWQILQCLQNEITDHTAVIHVHSWPKCIEYSCNTYCHIFLQLQDAIYGNVFTLIKNRTNPQRRICTMHGQTGQNRKTTKPKKATADIQSGTSNKNSVLETTKPKTDTQWNHLLLSPCVTTKAITLHQCFTRQHHSI